MKRNKTKTFRWNNWIAVCRLLVLLKLCFKPPTLDIFNVTQFSVVDSLPFHARQIPIWDTVSHTLLTAKDNWTCGIFVRYLCKTISGIFEFSTKHANANASGFHVNFSLIRRLCHPHYNWKIDPSRSAWTREKRIRKRNRQDDNSSSSTNNHYQQHIALNEYQFWVSSKKINFVFVFMLDKSKAVSSIELLNKLWLNTTLRLF